MAVTTKTQTVSLRVLPTRQLLCSCCRATGMAGRGPHRGAYGDQMKRMAEQGITSICDMSLMPMPGCDFIRDDVYDKLQAAGRLGIRAHLFPTLLDDQSRLEELQYVTRTTRCFRRRVLSSSSMACRVNTRHISPSPIPIRASRATRSPDGSCRAHAQVGSGGSRARPHRAHPRYRRRCHPCCTRYL